MRRTLRVLSALLRYPDEDVREAAGEFADVLAEEMVLDADECQALVPVIERFACDDLLDIQEDYVALFDRGRTFSLHLFEHVHGESRDRGQAMVDLRERYEVAGLTITAQELPDYIPLLLEYLSTLPEAQAREELAQPGLILAALAERLEAKPAPWAPVMRALARLAGINDPVGVRDDMPTMAEADDPDDFAALDAAWEEEQVRFEAPGAPRNSSSGAQAAACPQAASIIAGFGLNEIVGKVHHG